MNVFRPAPRGLRILAPRLLAATCLALLLNACGDNPDARERELRVLRQANESLRQQLIAAEQALAQARAESAEQPAPDHLPGSVDAPSSPDETAPAANTAAAPGTDAAVEDTTYIVVGKHHVPGRLAPQPTGSDPSAARRIDPIYQITFRGEQSARVYPPLNVAELAYPRFREGRRYTRADLNAAKLPGDQPASGNTTGGSAEPPFDFGSIFGIE